jgi:hemerythrin
MVIGNEQFATGSPILDTHHQMLINHINESEMLLDKSNLDRAAWEFVVGQVGFLGSYAAMHFKSEEQCMERYRCPAHTRNQLEHRRFMEFFRDFKEQCRAKGFRPEALKQMHEMASMWIQQHILQVDIQLKQYLPSQ